MHKAKGIAVIKRSCIFIVFLQILFLSEVVYACSCVGGWSDIYGSAKFSELVVIAEFIEYEKVDGDNWIFGHSKLKIHSVWKGRPSSEILIINDYRPNDMCSAGFNPGTNSIGKKYLVIVSRQMDGTAYLPSCGETYREIVDNYLIKRVHPDVVEKYGESVLDKTSIYTAKRRIKPNKIKK